MLRIYLSEILKKYMFETMASGLIFGLVVTPFIIRFFLFVLLVFISFEQIYFMIFGIYFGKHDLGKGVIFSFPIFITLTLISFFLFQVVLSIEIIWAISLSFIVLTSVSFLKKKMQSGRESVKVRTKFGSFDYDSLLIMLISFIFYFSLFYSFTYLSGQNTFLFSDDASYLTNFWAYTMRGENLTYSGAYLFTLNSNLVYVSSANSMSAWLLAISGATNFPILFYVIITALYGMIFCLSIMETALKNFSLFKKFFSLFLVFGGFSLIGILWLYSTALGSFAFLPKSFAGTPVLGQGGLIIYLKGTTDLILKGAWQGPGFICFAISIYTITDNNNVLGNKMKILYILSTLFAYVPLGLVLIVGYGFFLFVERFKIKSLRGVLFISILPPLLLRLFTLFFNPLYIPFLSIVITPSSLSSIIGSLIGVLIFVGAFIALILLDPFKLIKKNIPTIYVLPIILITLSIMMLLLFDTSLFPSFVTDNYLFGFSITICLFFIIRVSPLFSDHQTVEKPSANMRNGDKRNFSSNLSRLFRKESAVLFVIILLLAPTIIYASQPTYYNTSGNQAIYIDSNERDIAQWMRNNINKHSVIMVPPNYDWISSLTGDQLLVSSFAPSSNPRLLTVNSFYSSVSYNFSDNNSLIGWYPTAIHDGTAHIVRNSTISNNSILEICREEYSSYSTLKKYSMSSINISFSVFPLSVVGTPYISAPGISLILSNGKTIAITPEKTTSIFNATCNLSYYNFHINMTAFTWNNYSLSLSQIAKSFGIRDLNSTDIVQINLIGGIAKKIFWNYLAFYPETLNGSILEKFLLSNKISYIFSNEENNYYIFLLKNDKYINEMYTKGSMSIYEVQYHESY